MPSGTFDACTGVSVTLSVWVLPVARDAFRVGVDDPEAHPAAGADLDRRHQLELELDRTEREASSSPRDSRMASISSRRSELMASSNGTRPSSAMWRC